jgi:hypothetical protein
MIAEIRKTRFVVDDQPAIAAHDPFQIRSVVEQSNGD